MAWQGVPGSGNQLMAPTDVLAAGVGSFVQVFAGSLVIASGAAVQTLTNVGGAAAAITGAPQFYLQTRFGGVDYLIPLYRKT